VRNKEREREGGAYHGGRTRRRRDGVRARRQGLAVKVGVCGGWARVCVGGRERGVGTTYFGATWAHTSRGGVFLED
jgi:hypothetical protein